MRLITRHLTKGLIYARSLSLIPALAGTAVPLFWQLINLYGTLPAVLILLAMLQMTIAAISIVLYPFLFFRLGFIQTYFLAALFMAAAVIAWLSINHSINRRAGFQLIKLQSSTRTSLSLLSLLLCHRFLPLPLSPGTTFWDLHLKPNLAGRLKTKRRQEIITAIRHDYRQAQGMLGNAILFGCSPGSFRNVLMAAGLEESQFYILDTVIPIKHAEIFGVRKPFYFYVICLGPSLDNEIDG